MADPYPPFRIFELEHDPGTFCLMVSDMGMDPVADLFDANGRLANGYGFTDVTLQAIRSSAPELEAQIRFDPEAGTFVAEGGKAPIHALAALMHRLFHAPDELGPLVAAAPWEYD